MSDDEEIAALVIDNGSGMCKGMFTPLVCTRSCFDKSTYRARAFVDFR